MTTLNISSASELFAAEGLRTNYHVRKFLAEQAMEAEPLLMAFADFFGKAAAEGGLMTWRTNVRSGLPSQYPHSAGGYVSSECGQSMLRCIARETRENGFGVACMYVRGYLANDARFLTQSVQPEGMEQTVGAELLVALLSAIEKIVTTYGHDTLDAVLARWGIITVGTVAGWMMGDPSVVKGRM